MSIHRTTMQLFTSTKRPPLERRRAQSPFGRGYRYQKKGKREIRKRTCPTQSQSWWRQTCSACRYPSTVLTHNSHDTEGDQSIPSSTYDVDAVYSTSCAAAT